jgi:predicted Zn-dependent protease
LSSVSRQGSPQVDVRTQVRYAARQLNWLPMPVERMIGQQAHDSRSASLLADDRKGEKAYRSARRILNDVLAQVRDPHPYNFTVSIVKQSSGNAEAKPGGFVYIDRDLVEKPANEPRAYFAIAHEVAHVLQRHETREIQARLADGVDSVEGLQKLMSSVNSDPKPVLAKARDLKRLFVRHSEEQELQADACAVRLLDSLMQDKRQLKGVIEAYVKSLPPSQPSQVVASQKTEDMLKELGDGKFSSHPNTDVRVSNLNTMLHEVEAGR